MCYTLLWIQDFWRRSSNTEYRARCLLSLGWRRCYPSGHRTLTPLLLSLHLGLVASSPLTSTLHLAASPPPVWDLLHRPCPAHRQSAWGLLWQPCPSVPRPLDPMDANCLCPPLHIPTSSKPFNCYSLPVHIMPSHFTIHPRPPHSPAHLFSIPSLVLKSPDREMEAWGSEKQEDSNCCMLLCQFLTCFDYLVVGLGIMGEHFCRNIEWRPI